MESKKFITARGALFLLALVLIAAILFYLLDSAPQGVQAVVRQDGVTVLTQDLASLTAPQEDTFHANGHTVTIRFSPDGAQVLSSTCPDQVCVRTGKITRAGESAICLPARITVRLEGGAAGFDAATY